MTQSGLVSEWIERTRESAESTSLDRLVYAESRDRRVPFTRMAVVGGVVDGRASKPGVLLTALTSDGAWQELGVSDVDHARAVVEALLCGTTAKRAARQPVRHPATRLTEGERWCTGCVEVALCVAAFSRAGVPRWGARP